MPVRHTLRLIAPVLLQACVLSSAAHSQGYQDPIDAFIGKWEHVEKPLFIEFRDDHEVFHSALGSGDIQHENADIFKISYRSHPDRLTCRYKIRHFFNDRLSFVAMYQPAPDGCELGVLERPVPSKVQKKHVAPRRDSAAAAPKSPADENTVASATPPAEQSVGGPAFKDCGDCPEMLTVPAGGFLMGSKETEAGRREAEGPLHKVTFRSEFAASRYAITQAEFKTFVEMTRHPYGRSCRSATDVAWRDTPGSFLEPPSFRQDGDHPAVCISWHDANAYVNWLSQLTKSTYRLLTEAEREYVARAGTETPYWWGPSISAQHANYDLRERKPSLDGKGHAAFLPVPASVKLDGNPVGTRAVHSFEPNPWGFLQVHGNVAEWVSDCWNKTYNEAPTDGSAATKGDCTNRVLRGGAWSYWPEDVRAAYREPGSADQRYFHVGFRVAKDLGPPATAGDEESQLLIKDLTRRGALSGAQASQLDALKMKRQSRGLNLQERKSMFELSAPMPQRNLEINFAYDSDEITAAAAKNLDVLGKALQAEGLTGKTILLGGHTDARGSAEYNRVLSQKRADAAKRYLVQNFTVPADRLMTVGYGFEHLINKANPFADENRRVQVVNTGS